MSTSIFNRRALVLLTSLMTLAGCSDKQIFTETSCSVDSVNGSGELVITAKRNGILKVEGWAADGLSKQTPESVSINFVSSAGVVSEFAESKLFVARPDVSAFLKAPSVTHAGFGVSAKLESQLPGIYEIQLLQNFPDRILACKSNKTIKIE